jgi:hypothetical protein
MEQVGVKHFAFHVDDVHAARAELVESVTRSPRSGTGGPASTSSS